MKTLEIELIGGELIYDVLKRAVDLNQSQAVSFTFNGYAFEIGKGEAFKTAKARWEKLTGIEALTRDEMAERASVSLAETEAKTAKAIKDTGSPSEMELRNSEAPWPKSMQELTDYITSLVERPHDYGTCVYAMSLSAVAAFRFAASKVGATGFQASCADMDIIRRTRGIERFQILNHENLLYPQYCNSEHFPDWNALIEKNKTHLAEEARKLLASAKRETCHPDVAKHWLWLSELAPVEAAKS